MSFCTVTLSILMLFGGAGGNRGTSTCPALLSMSEQPLPAFWTEEVDTKGRRFYTNHIARTTQWEPPGTDEPSIPPEMPPTRRRNIPQQGSQSHVSQDTVHWEYTPRVRFWVAAAMVLPVWIFVVSAMVDDNWLDDVSLSVVDENILSHCADESLPTEFYGFCDLYVSFMMMQLVAFTLASVALVMLSMALFLPAEASSCCSAKVYGLTGGVALAAYAAFQLSALILMIVIDKAEHEKAYFFDDPNAGQGLGSTFWVAVVGFIVAVFDATILIITPSSAGDGLFYECIKLVALNR